MKLFYTVAFVLLITIPAAVKAQGNLMVLPKRVVFEGARRVQEITLANSGTDSARYSISLVQYRMEKTGAFTEVTEPDSGQNFATKYLRFFPKAITLGPNESQVIKMQMVNTSQLAPGEYRSHLYLRNVPKLGPQITDRGADTATKAQISVKLIAQYGISIPIIIRVGQSNTTASLTNAFLKYEGNKPFLQMDINRSGNMSVYGDIRVKYIADNGKISDVNGVEGLAVYTPNKMRTIAFELSPKSGQDMHKGKLQVTFVSQGDSRAVTYAQTEVPLK